MKAFANIKSRYAEYKALDSADKAKAWKEGLINNAIYLLIIIAVIYTYTQNSSGQGSLYTELLLSEDQVLLGAIQYDSTAPEQFSPVLSTE